MELANYLAQHESASFLRFATAGSVDDGKSTLIGRLLYDSKALYDDQLAAVEAASTRGSRREVDLAWVMDGLLSEREQGITIDVAYRYFSTPRRRFIIADVPGHEQYTRNMVTGISTANLVVILLDASKGMTTQSKRHAFLTGLMRIPHLVVAVNKMDRVDHDQSVYQCICKEFGDYAARLGIRDVHFIPTVATTGANVVDSGADVMPWYTGKPLLTHLEEVYLEADRNLVDLRLPVQYVNRPNAEFRGYCGSVASGIIRTGERIAVVPSGVETTVASIRTIDGPREYAFAGQAVTVTFEDPVDCARGDMLVHPGNRPQSHTSLQLMAVWMHESPLREGGVYLVSHCSSAVRATVQKIHYRVDPNTAHREASDSLGLNDIGRVTLELLRPLACDPYERNRETGALIFIDPDNNETVGAGTIIDRQPAQTQKHSKPLAAPRSANIVKQTGHVSREERTEVFGHKPRTVWLTGLSGAGKSTIGFTLERQLLDLGHACYVLDGDNVRHGLNRDLGFAPADRAENLRRIAEVAKLMNEAGLIVITCFISPTIAARDAARKIIGDEQFIEVFVDAPIAVCEDRDPKGLYRKARAGKIPNFTGISAPFEAPAQPELHLRTDAMTVDDCVEQIIGGLEASGSFAGTLRV